MFGKRSKRRMEKNKEEYRALSHEARKQYLVSLYQAARSNPFRNSRIIEMIEAAAAVEEEEEAVEKLHLGE